VCVCVCVFLFVLATDQFVLHDQSGLSLFQQTMQNENEKNNT